MSIRNYLKSCFGNTTAATMARTNLRSYQAKYLEHQCEAAYHGKLAEFYKEGIQRMAGFKPVVTPTELQNAD